MSRVTKILGKETGGPDWLWASLSRGRQHRKRGRRLDELQYENNHHDIKTFAEIYSNNDVPIEVTAEAFPANMSATDAYINNQVTSAKWILEAMLIANVPYEEISASLQPGLSVEAIDVYHRAFFDIDEGLHNPAWMTKHIWVPALHDSSHSFFYNFVYKVTSFYGKRELFMDLLNPQYSGESVQDWMQQLVKGQRNRFMLTKGIINANLPDNEYIVVHDNIVQAWDRAKAERSLLSNGGDSEKALGMLVEALDTTVRMLSPGDEGSPRTEHFVTAKFTDEEKNKITTRSTK